MEEEIKKLQEQVKVLSANAEELKAAKEQLKETSQFIEDASVLVSAIMKDPDLRTHVQKTITGEPVAPKKDDDPVVPSDGKKGWKFDPLTGKPIGETVAPAEPPKDERVDSLDGQKRLEIIDVVEKKFKYSNLKPEEIKTLRAKVGTWLNSYNMKVATIPVDQLEEKLSDAYLHVGLESASKDGKADEVVEAYFEDPGKLPGMGSGSTDNPTTTLNPAQKKWANKLQVPEDKVAEGLKELTETGSITYKPKEKEAEEKTETPSGQPTPPASE